MGFGSKTADKHHCNENQEKIAKTKMEESDTSDRVPDKSSPLRTREESSVATRLLVIPAPAGPDLPPPLLKQPPASSHLSKG